MMIDRPFYVAVTHSAIEDVLETPLIVAHVTEKEWRKC